MDALLRHWRMLLMIPRHPGRVETAKLEKALLAEGFEVSRRTIQRDLNYLSDIFPINTDENKPAGWFWIKDADPVDVPGLDPHTALTFQMAQDFLGRMLPSNCLEFLQPHFRRSAKVLQELPSGLGSWRKKIGQVSRSFPLPPPRIDPGVLAAVYDSLLHECRLSVRYCRRGETSCREYRVNPLGLVFADQVIYLVGTISDHKNPSILAVHRIEHAVTTGEPAHRPENFDLSEYIASGAFGFPVGEGTIRLRAWFAPSAALHLQETPLSEDQHLVPEEDGFRVEGTVPNTAQLRWWILGFGDQVEVLEPPELRKEISATVQGMAKAYGTSRKGDKVASGG